MSYVKPKKIVWVNSTATDVVAHRVYVVDEGGSIDPVSTQHVEVPVPTNEYEMPGTFDITEGRRKVGVAAVDATGNISNTIEQVFDFDFLPPIPPTNLQLVDS